MVFRKGHWVGRGEDLHYRHWWTLKDKEVIFICGQFWWPTSIVAIEKKKHIILLQTYLKWILVNVQMFFIFFKYNEINIFCTIQNKTVHQNIPVTLYTKSENLVWTGSLEHVLPGLFGNTEIQVQCMHNPASCLH